MHGAISTLPNTPSRGGAQLKSTVTTLPLPCLPFSAVLLALQQRVPNCSNTFPYAVNEYQCQWRMKMSQTNFLKHIRASICSTYNFLLLFKYGLEQHKSTCETKTRLSS
jgi:hypothetical protein